MRALRPFLAPLIVPVLALAACGTAADDEATTGAGNQPAEAATTATGELQGELQAVSLLGEDLYARVDTEGVIAAADAALAESPDDVELLIAAGRVRRDFWQYRGAIELYSRAIERAPDDWRPYRFRGHRYISVRQLDEAIPDLEQARTLAPYNWDVAYHLGLAYYVSGRFDDAADEYVRCLNLADDDGARAAQSNDFRSCSQNGSDAGSAVAMIEWAVRALLRAGRSEQADELIAPVPDNLLMPSNVAYYHDLLYSKGVKSAEELLELGDDAPYRLETVGYGVAVRLMVDGEEERAVEILERIVADPWWPGFGRIAAEADLARLR